MASTVQSNPVYYSLSSLSSTRNSTSHTVVLRKRPDHEGFGVYIGEDIPSGLYVVTVERNSPASDANIQPGDRVLAVNGQLVASMSTNPKEMLIKAASKADSLTLTIQPTNILQSLDLPTTNSYKDTNDYSKKKQPARQTLPVNSDLEGYIKSLFANENVQILQTSKNNEYVLKSDPSTVSSTTDFNSLPTLSQHTSDHKKERRHRHHHHQPRETKRATLVTKETQTSFDYDEDEDILQEQLPPSPPRQYPPSPPRQYPPSPPRQYPQQPSMGISHRTLYAQPPVSSHHSSNESMQSDKDLNVPVAPPSPPPSNLTRKPKSNAQPTSQHMAEVVEAVLTVQRQRQRNNNQERKLSDSSVSSSEPVTPPPTSHHPPANSRDAAPTSRNPPPTTRDTAPTSRDSAPTSRDSAPTSRDTASTSRNPAPASRDTAPTSRDSVPTSRNPALASRDTAPTSRDSAPTSRDSAPTSRDSAPTSRDTASTSRNPAPASRDSAPTSRDSAPTSRDSAPTSRNPAPTSRDTAPTSRDSAPTSRDSAPTSRDSAPTSRDSAPTSRDSAPTSRDAAPTSRDSAPTSRDTAPTSRNPAPTSRDSAPTSRDAAPTSRDAAPTSRDSAPTSRDAAPTSRNPAPSSRDSAPADGRNAQPPPQNELSPPPYTETAPVYTSLPAANNQDNANAGAYNVRDAEQNQQAATAAAAAAPAPPSGLREVQLHRSSDFEGFGFHLQYNKSYYLVQRIEPGSPSEHSGLHANDVIHTLNGKPTADMSHGTFVATVNDSSSVNLSVQTLDEYLHDHPPVARNKATATAVAAAISHENEKRKTGISKALGKLTNR